MLKIEIAEKAAKFLLKLPLKHARQVATKIQELRKNPAPHDAQFLKGYEPYRRVDTGEYRIIYFLQDDILKIDLVGKRNNDEAYRQLKRL